MPKAVKSNTPTSAPASEPAPKATTAKAKTIKPSKPEPQPVVVAPVSDVSAVADDSVPDVSAGESDEVMQTINAVYGKVQSLSTELATVKAQLRLAMKMYEKKVKALSKSNKKQRKANPNRKPTGFQLPTKISDDLADFLKVARGSEMSRTDANKLIHKYIKEHNLKEATNGRNITCDGALGKLVGDLKGEQLTFFNLQKYMKHHYETNKPQSV